LPAPELRLVLAGRPQPINNQAVHRLIVVIQSAIFNANTIAADVLSDSFFYIDELVKIIPVTIANCFTALVKIRVIITNHLRHFAIKDNGDAVFGADERWSVHVH